MNELFQKQVWEITRLVPAGRVTTYGAVARAVGYPNHSRHVEKRWAAAQRMCRHIA